MFDDKIIKLIDCSKSINIPKTDSKVHGNKNIGRIPIPNFNPYFSISFPETKVLNINSKNFINPKNKPRNEVISVLVLKNSLVIARKVCPL